MLRIFSWNVNGLRAVLRKNALQDFLSEFRPDILCLQEIKAKSEQVEYDFDGYKEFWNPAERLGYSGTAILVSEKMDLKNLDVIRWSADRAALAGEPVRDSGNIRQDFSNQAFDFPNTDIAVHEGRILVLEFPKFFLVNVYTPNSKPDLSRLKLRETEWDPGFLEFLKQLEEKKPVITCGDFNAAHEEIDIARPATNHHSAGFTDEERQGITNLVNAGFVDTFRALNPDSVRYTWWSHWGHARENNVGWRIDYFFASQSIFGKIKGAEIYENVLGSDHCPVSIDLEI